ncbi:MAG: fasciclin domain-containing protein [Saprospiraceae bacterium]|nr:fasciclin domain-containing protein [Saprospiraceae bacterium]
MKQFAIVVFSFVLSLASTPSQAQCNSNSKGHQSIVDIAIGSDVHTTLVSALKAADLVETLAGDGPFTVFAPTNAAFAHLPAGTVDGLLKPSNKGQLQSVLTYHVIAGKFDARKVIAAIEDSAGQAVLETVQGGKIKARLNRGHVVLEDENGNISTVTATDLEGSNGIIHVVDAVVLPHS